jgi:hypothetical protein
MNGQDELQRRALAKSNAQRFHLLSTGIGKAQFGGGLFVILEKEHNFQESEQ